MFHNDPPSADEDVARLRFVLCHTDLSTLEEHGFVVWDRDENVVWKGPRYEAIAPVSELLGDRGRELPDDCP